MDIIDFFRAEQKNLHAALRSSVSDLTPDEWHYTLGNGNHIAFILWHCVRTEDNIMRFILQQRPPIWNEGNWHERLQLPPRVQGTGMATEEAHTLHLNDPALFMQYAEQVWRESEQYLASINDGGAALSQRMVMVKPLGEITALWAIGRVCITHLLTHLGEISLLRGAQGKQGQFL
jgi:hypothetical protein